MKRIAFLSFVAALDGIQSECDTAVISGVIAAVGCAAAEVARRQGYFRP